MRGRYKSHPLTTLSTSLVQMEILSPNQFLFPTTPGALNNGRKLVVTRGRAALGISIPIKKTPRALNNGRNLNVIRASVVIEQQVTETKFLAIPHQPFDAGAASEFVQRVKVPLADLDPATAKLVIGILGPFLSAFGFLFVLRIVMSWYPKLPVGKFPYVLAYAPTEPILIPTRKLIPPLGGVDVTPVVWFGLISFLNEILVGPQGLLVLLSQQVN